jgi:hypothetical protein
MSEHLKQNNLSNTTGATSGAEIAYPPEHMSSPPGFSGVRVAQSLVFSAMFCRSFFVLLAIVFYFISVSDSI